MRHNTLWPWALLAAACTSAPSSALDGNWAGAQMRFSVGAPTIRLTMACYNGQFDGPMTPDGSGAVSTPGWIHTSDDATYSAVLLGQVAADTMTVTLAFGPHFGDTLFDTVIKGHTIDFGDPTCPV